MKKVFLIGFMGVGKTTIGKQISGALNMGFIDTDKSIESKEGKIIVDIFNYEGEVYFRGIEHSFLSKELVDNTLYSTGGGMPCFNNCIDLMLRSGVVVFINMDWPIVWSRIKNSKTRPLVSSDEDKLLNLYNSRLEYYNKADIIYNVKGWNAKKRSELCSLIKSTILEKQSLL
jgi:shikimate kinase